MTYYFVATINHVSSFSSIIEMNNKLQNTLFKFVLILNIGFIPFCKVDQREAQSTEANSQVIEKSRTLRPSLHSVLPSHLMPMSPIETYLPSNLYEVINGQANAYLKAGFVELTTQLLKIKEHPSKWFEIYIYQMSRHLSAFAVFSGQRRSNAKRLNITPFAYQARNALFFVHGSFYVEIIGSDETDSLISVMQGFAQAFVNQNPVQEKPIPELSLFPVSNLVPNSLTMFPDGAFGFDKFKDVFVARYQSKGDQVTVFISRCPNPSKAVNLGSAYQEFLKQYGGEVVPLSSQLLNATLIRIQDMFELVFTYDVYIAGVHQAPTQEAAESLAKQLSVKLSTVD